MGNMNPSTFQQVRENMEKILVILSEDPENPNSIPNIIERLEQIEEIINNITKPDAGGDIGTDENNNIIVYGVTLVTEFSDTDTAPASYKRNVTYELKKPSAIGLNETPGFESDYILVMTYTNNLEEGESVDLYKYRGQQIAVGANAVLYTRTGTEDSNSWGEWVAVTSAGGGGSSVKQWINADVEPIDQQEGDYWTKSIE